MRRCRLGMRRTFNKD